MPIVTGTGLTLAHIGGPISLEKFAEGAPLPRRPNAQKGPEVETSKPLKNGGRSGTRTLDPLIKSQLLYQLS